MKKPFENMSDFKAIALDYAYYLTLEENGSLYCLNERQIYILLALCEYVGWFTRWYNTEDINRFTVQYIQSELMEALMQCVDISIIVTQGQLTLTTQVQQQQIESQRLRERYGEQYDGSPTSINPNAPTTNFGAAGDRYDALCAALTAFVYQFARAQVQAIIAGDIAAYALLASAALLLIPGLNLFYIAGASLALLAGGGIIGVTTAVAIAALTDTNALNNVICFMLDTLKSESVSEANWSSALDSYPFAPGSHEAIIADFIKPTLGDNYFGALDMMGQGYGGITGGDPTPACPCSPAVGQMAINIVSSPDAMLELVSADDDQETIRVTTQLLPNTYFYASLTRQGGGQFRVESVEMEEGSFYQWSSQYGVYSDLNWAVDEDFDASIAALDFYGTPGTQAVYLMTVTLL